MQNNKIAKADRRFIYISDPSSIARLYLPENVEEKNLRDWVDDLSDVEVDTFIQEVYTQGWTTYWKTPLFEYDARPHEQDAWEFERIAMITFLETVGEMGNA